MGLSARYSAGSGGAAASVMFGPLACIDFLKAETHPTVTRTAT